MEDTLITKKELLEQTGISYGALYRWKRKELIPDDWFIHRATFTGQETFFPKEKILERIQKIMQLKDGMSLDDIAETFSPVHREVSMTPAEAERAQIASRSTIELFIQSTGNGGPYSFDDLFEIFLLDRLLKTGDLGREDAVAALPMVSEGLRLKKEGALRLLVFRKMGVTFGIVTDENATIFSDIGAKTVLVLSIGSLMSELKQVLNRDVI